MRRHLRTTACCLAAVSELEIGLERLHGVGTVITSSSRTRYTARQPRPRVLRSWRMTCWLIESGEIAARIRAHDWALSATADLRARVSPRARQSISTASPMESGRSGDRPATERSGSWLVGRRSAGIRSLQRALGPMLRLSTIPLPSGWSRSVSTFAPVPGSREAALQTTTVDSGCLHVRTERW